MSYTLEEMTERVRGAVGADSGLGKTLKFDLKGDGVIHIDGGTVTNEDKPADLTMTIAKDDRDHPFGVWTLPPTRASAPRGQPPQEGFDHAPFDAVGESDRMTLRFRKPA